MPLRWLLLAASARCLVVPRAPRPGNPSNAKVVVADGFTATANAGFASLRDAWLPAVGDGDELEVHDRTAPGDVVAVLDGAAVAEGRARYHAASAGVSVSQRGSQRFKTLAWRAARCA